MDQPRRRAPDGRRRVETFLLGAILGMLVVIALLLESIRHALGRRPHTCLGVVETPLVERSTWGRPSQPTGGHGRCEQVPPILLIRGLRPARQRWIGAPMRVWALAPWTTTDVPEPS